MYAEYTQLQLTFPWVTLYLKQNTFLLKSYFLIQNYDNEKICETGRIWEKFKSFKLG